MSRINKDDRREKQNNWYKWRWEFTRRNDAYKQIYNEAIQIRAEQGFESEWEKNQVKNFGLLSDCLIDPEKSFDDILKVRKKLEKKYRKIELLQDVVVENPSYYEELHFFPSTFWSHYAKITPTDKGFCLNVDLTSVNSLGALHDDLDKYISLHCNNILKNPKIKKHYFPGLREFHITKETKKYCPKFERILDLGDDIENIKNEMRENFSFRIALKKLYPDISDKIDYENLPCNTCKKDDTACNTCKYSLIENDDPESKSISLYQQVLRDYNLYKSLIRGDYRGVSYP